MSEGKRNLSIDAVIVTYNSRAMVCQCVAATRAAGIDSIVVVDNASTDGTASALRERFDWLEVVRFTEHAGLSRAFNAGWRAGRFPYVLFLNDDVFAEPDAPAILRAALTSNPGAASAGGRLVDVDTRETQDRYRPQRFPTATRLVLGVVGVRRLRQAVRVRRRWVGMDPREVDQPAGACLLVRRDALERIGGWDERFWFWYEDVDLSRRLSRSSSALYVPRAVFRHVGGATVSRWSFAEGHERSYRGMLLYSQEHLSRAGSAAVGAATAAIATIRALLALSRRRPMRPYVRTAWAGVRVSAGKRLQSAALHPTPRPPAGGWSCPACGGSSHSQPGSFEPAATFRTCRTCGLHQLLDHLGERRESYTDAYYDSYPGLGSRYFADRSQRRLEAESRFAFLSRHLDGLAGASLLEVGPGSGDFLAVAQDAGWSVEAIEPAPRLASELQERGFTAHPCHLEDFAGDRPFQAICAWQVFEHFSNPLAASSQFQHLAGEGAWLFLELPNVDSFVARVLKRKWANLDPENHPYQYTPSALEQLLIRTGFSPTTIETVPTSIYYDRRLRRDPGRLVKRGIVALGARATARGAYGGHEFIRVAARAKRAMQAR